MKRSIVIVSLILLMSCNQSVDREKKALTLDDEQARLGYAFGMSVDLDATKGFSGLDREMMLAGLNDGLDANDTKLSEQDAARAKEKIKDMKKEAKMAAFKRLQEENGKKARAFLLEHAKKEGVTVTEDGLQYEVIKQGDGAKPGPNARVKVLYSGTLMDGTVFNPYHKPDIPAYFNLDKVIPGWSEGLQLMPVGSKYRFVMPPLLAFGAVGPGNNIPPNAVMIFEIELLDIEEDKSVTKGSVK